MERKGKTSSCDAMEGKRRYSRWPYGRLAHPPKESTISITSRSKTQNVENAERRWGNVKSRDNYFTPLLVIPLEVNCEIKKWETLYGEDTNKNELCGERLASSWMPRNLIVTAESNRNDHEGMRKQHSEGLDVFVFGRWRFKITTWNKNGKPFFFSETVHHAESHRTRLSTHCQTGTPLHWRANTCSRSFQTTRRTTL